LFCGGNGQESGWDAIGMITAKPFRILIGTPGEGVGGWVWDESGKSFGILVKEFEGEWNVKIARRGSNAKAAIGHEKRHQIAKIAAHSSNFKAGDDHA
jgi:hypothetical protein